MNNKLTVYVDYPNQPTETYVIELPGIPRANDTLRLDTGNGLVELTVKRVGWHADTMTTVLDCAPYDEAS